MSQVGNRVEGGFRDLSEVKADRLDLHRTVFELAEVKNVGDDALEVFCRGPDAGDVFLLCFGQVGRVFHDCRQAADTV